MNPAGGRKSGEHSVVEYDQCRSRHRGGNMPATMSTNTHVNNLVRSYSHGAM